MNQLTVEQLTTIAIGDAHRDVAVKSKGWLITRIYVTDLQLILDRIAALCPGHGACEWCDRAVCVSCGLGDFAPCDCPALHCRSDSCMATCVENNHLDDDQHQPLSWVAAR